VNTQVDQHRVSTKSRSDLSGVYAPLGGRDDTAKKAAARLNALTAAWAETCGAM
jgi:hypothetical protein